MCSESRRRPGAHGWMPVILKPEDYARWLDPSSSGPRLSWLLDPLLDDWLSEHHVGKLGNNAGTRTRHASSG